MIQVSKDLTVSIILIWLFLIVYVDRRLKNKLNCQRLLKSNKKKALLACWMVCGFLVDTFQLLQSRS